MTIQDLIDFESRVAEAFNSGIIHAPIHLSGGNESQLIDIFKGISRDDYVFSTHRSHYHALLHGVPEEKLMDEILAGHSMNLNFPEHKFYTSAIVGGILPIALGMAMGIKLNEQNEFAIAFHSDGTQTKFPTSKIWCFIGDMAAETGIFHECFQYADWNDLPITFVIEDNGMSTDTPTELAWGGQNMLMSNKHIARYFYTRQHPHVGSGKMVTFV